MLNIRIAVALLIIIYYDNMNYPSFLPLLFKTILATGCKMAVNYIYILQRQENLIVEYKLIKYKTLYSKRRWLN